MKNIKILTLLVFPFLLCGCGNNPQTSSSTTTEPTQVVTKDYKINFVTKSDEKVDPLTYKEGSTVSVKDLPSLKDRDPDENVDCRFVCWTLNGSDVVEDFKMPSNDITLTAKWRVLKQWTVYFDTGIDDYEIDEIYLSEDEGGLDAFIMPKFEDEYHVLLGWFYDEDFTDPVGDKLNETKFTNFEVTLYAETECGKTTVYFDAGQGTVDTPTKDVEYGSALGIMPTATRSGYDFEGWTLDGELVDEAYVPGAINEITLVAMWDTADTYDVWDGSVADTFAEGTGVENDPYIINSAKELRLFANLINGDEATRENYKSSYYKLNTGIDLNNKTWLSIGNAKTKPFMGVFDGNNHKIKNLSVTTLLCYAGLFGYIVDADILNLKVSGKVVEKTDGFMTGLVAAVMFKSTISNCVAIGSALGYKESVGGIVGKNNNLNGNVATRHTLSTIQNCTNYASVTLVNPLATHNGTAAGILGMATNHEVNITNCRNSGRVQGGNNCGGILGKNLEAAKTIISNCTNTGTITGVAADDTFSYAGGIAGMIRKCTGTLITGCYNYGNISTPTTNAAGIVGLLRATLTDCYCANDVLIIGQLVSEDRLYNNNMNVMPGAAICWQCDVNNGGNISNCGLCNPLD